MSTFLHELHERKLKYQRSDFEVKDIKEAVHEVVETIAARIGQQEHAFEISHKYLAGSMAEGTSINEPNEFDVLLVLRHLSSPGAIGVEKVMIENEDCYIDPIVSSNILPTSLRHVYKHIHAHIRALSSNVTKMFSFCVTNGYFGNFDLNLSFNKHVVKAFKSLSPVKRRTGVLSIDTADKPTEGSASTFALRWTPLNAKSLVLDISVDLVPAIELLGINTGDLDPELRAYNDRLISENKYLVIPGKLAHKCFLFTFTNTEVSLIRGMSVNHKTCYRLLKYILQIRIHSKVFSSYMTKTFVLRHAAFCRDDSDVLRCTCGIIMAMLASFGTLYKNSDYQHRNAIHTDVRCIFMKSNYVSTDLYDGHDCGAIINGLNSIIKQLEDIKKKEDNEDISFERCYDTFDTFVRHLRRRRYLLKLKHDG